MAADGSGMVQFSKCLDARLKSRGAPAIQTAPEESTEMLSPG
jgi:hypothetical protein